MRRYQLICAHYVCVLVATVDMLILCGDLQGWWDQDWLGCPYLAALHNESSYMESISTAMALHTRYPGHGGHTPVAGSQLERTLDLISNVFDQCQTRTCIHERSVPLVDYLYYDINDDYSSHQQPRRLAAQHARSKSRRRRRSSSSHS